MALRKEQVLVLATLALGLLIWKSGGDGSARVPTLTATKVEYKAEAVPKAPLLDGVAAMAATRRWFREPSETQPLPPRELPFPARGPAPLVALPLDPGPDLSRADLLLLPGDVTADVTLQPTAAAAPADAPVGGSGDDIGQHPQSTLEDKRQRYAKTYDRVTIGTQVYFGILRAPGQDLFELEQKSNFDGVVVYLLEFQLSKEKLVPPELKLPSDPSQPIARIQLADTTRNIVARMVRAVPEDIAHEAERLQLIDRLLLMARQDGSVYEAVMKQVDVLAKSSTGLVAERARARALFTKGDIAGEYSVYRGITAEDGPAGAFKYEGLGNLEARLGLFAAAERDLRRAAQLAPTDARPAASLAAFLRQHGRAREAALAAQRALAAIGAVTDAVDQQRVAIAVVGSLLGAGDLDGARQALQAIPLGGAKGLASFLRASIDYAAGNVTAARDSFRTASADGYGPAAQLGVAACQLRLGEWQDAFSGFEAVADQAPLLRQRALDGLAVLYLRIGQYDNALAQVDRALEADPTDTYALFLRARAQQEQGQAVPALETLAQVLRQRDDFVAAVSAVADLRLRLFRDGDATEQASNAFAAMRYSDRAVALSPVQRQDLYERQGLAHFAGADLRGAGGAFARARDVAPNDGERLFAQAALALVDYAQDHVDDAVPQLERLRDEAGLPKDHPMRQWATATLLMIDDHAQKEQLDDHFERDEAGSIWDRNAERGLTVEIADHRLAIQGDFAKGGQEVGAMRKDAVPKAGHFLAVAVRMQLGKAHAPESFAGLRIQTRGGGANADFTAQVGARDGHLFWQVREGREEPVRSPADAPTFGSGVHRLELRVEDRGEKLFKLLVMVDGAVVGMKDLTMLRGSDLGRSLDTWLVVVGSNRPGHVDVAFDDYHLERRKD